MLSLFVAVAVNVVVVVLIVVAIHKGLVVVDKNYLIHIKAITVVALASRPCLDLSLTLLLP